MADVRWRPGDPVDWKLPGELWTSGGLHSFVLETTGARTGLVRHAVLGYLEEGTDGWLVIGSYGGAPTHPAWVANLAAQPDATVVLADGCASRSTPSGWPARSSRRPGADRRGGAGVSGVSVEDHARDPGHSPRSTSNPSV